MLRIGEFAEITGVTRRLLRHYDAIGVLSPARTDLRTGYRYYTRDQIAALQRVLIYREAGVPLDLIPVVIDTGDRSDAVETVLVRHRAALVEERAALDRKLACLDAQLAGLAGLPASDRPFRIKRTAPAWAVSVRRIVETYADADALLRETRRDVETADQTRSAAIWHRCRPAEGHIDCEAQALLARRPVGDRIPAQYLPARLVVSFPHTGPESELPAIYDQMRRWTHAVGYQYCGPLREVYWDSADGTPIVDVQFPIARS